MCVSAFESTVKVEIRNASRYQGKRSFFEGSIDLLGAAYRHVEERRRHIYVLGVTPGLREVDRYALRPVEHGDVQDYFMRHDSQFAPCTHLHYLPPLVVHPDVSLPVPRLSLERDAEVFSTNIRFRPANVSGVCAGNLS